MPTQLKEKMSKTTWLFSVTAGEVRSVKEFPAKSFGGGPGGFSEKNMTEVPMRSGYEATVADLNANGFTDIIIMNQMHHGQKDDPFAGANIFWGSAGGYDFSEEGRTVLNEFYLGSSNVADLNKEWLP
jgi:hypothetical protein